LNSIELMIEEHKNILRMLAVVRKASYDILLGKEICFEDFEQMIDFIRNYADVHHHGKEEQFLFKEMVEHLGPLGDKLITHGMLVEHDWGRLFIRELSSALDRVKSGDDMSKIDVIANAVGYANHLQRHIEKEDKVVYTFAQRQLPKEIMDKIEKDSATFEKNANDKNIPSNYLTILKNLEQKYQ
jgi:hemerythrin-like domain-containing protein